MLDVGRTIGAINQVAGVFRREGSTSGYPVSVPIGHQGQGQVIPDALRFQNQEPEIWILKFPVIQNPHLGTFQVGGEPTPLKEIVPDNVDNSVSAGTQRSSSFSFSTEKSRAG